MPHQKTRQKAGAPAPKQAPKSTKSLLKQLETAVAANPGDIDSALALAEHYNNHGLESRLPALLSPFESQYPFEDQFIRGNYNRLLGFGHAHCGRFLNAEQVIGRGLADYPESLDFLYAQCFIKLSLLEYSDAIAAGEKYLAVYEKLGEDSRSSQVFNGMASHLSQLYNFLGSAWLGQSKTDTAQHYFNKAIQADETNHLPYLNLATLYIRQKNWDVADQTIRRGLKLCQQVQELRILAESLKKKATISACLMVKNEEEMLPGCLESIRDWVDEIIVVDTGSTDRTVEVAKSYGAQIYHHPWEGSFSKSRNHTLQYATKDWVFIIDADERLYAEDIPQVIKAVNTKSADVVTVNVYNVYKEHEDMVVFLPSHRFIRRELNPRYDGIVHNQLVLPDTARFVRTSIRIRHLGYGLSTEKMREKTARTRALLEKQLKENPNNTFALFNYAQLLRSGPDGFQKEYAPLIIDAAGRAVDLTGPDDQANRHIYLMCLDQLAWTHYYLGEYDKAFEYCTKALVAKPNYLDPLLLCGYIAFQKKDLEKATLYFEKYLKAQATYDPSKELENIILIHLNSRVDALFNLGAIAELSGDTAKARMYYLDALKLNERYVGANLNLGRLYLQENNLTEAERCFSRLLESGNLTEPALLGLAKIYQEWNDALRAEHVLKQALELNPISCSALGELGDLYLASGRYDDAVEVLRTAYQANPSSQSIGLKLGDTLSRVGQFAQAIKVYTNLEKHAPLTPSACNDLANCYYRSKAFTLAEKYYQMALDADPEFYLAGRNLGLTKAQLQKPQEAIDLLRDYLDRMPGQIDLEHVIADLYAGLEDYQSALTYYERYLRHRPSDPGALFQLSECYLKLGHRDSAILGYRRVLELDPLCHAAQERLAESAPVGQPQ